MRRRNTHFREIGFLWFSGIVGDLESHYGSDTKQVTWHAARQSKAPKVLKKAPKDPKLCQNTPEIGQRGAGSLLEGNKARPFLNLDPIGRSIDFGQKSIARQLKKKRK